MSSLWFLFLAGTLLFRYSYSSSHSDNLKLVFGSGNASIIGSNICSSLLSSRSSRNIKINTCNGFYCNDFTPNNANSPKIWTENWTGWIKAWDLPDPHRQAEDLAYSVVRFFINNGTLQNYYMYHGGTNFGRTTGPYITTSYDYDAPLDEYGNKAAKMGPSKEPPCSYKTNGEGYCLWRQKSNRA